MFPGRPRKDGRCGWDGKGSRAVKERINLNKLMSPSILNHIDLQSLGVLHGYVRLPILMLLAGSGNQTLPNTSHCLIEFILLPDWEELYPAKPVLLFRSCYRPVQSVYFVPKE